MIYHQNFFGGAAAHAALVSSSSLLHVRTARPTSPYSPPFLHAMLFLDFTLSVIESELRVPSHASVKLGVIVRARETEVYFCLFHSHYDAMLYADMGLHLENCVFLSKPCKRGAKQTTISNLRNMLFKKQHFFSDILEKICLK